MIFPTVTSFASTASPVPFGTNTNPIKNYFYGDTSTQWSILVHHLQVKGFVYMNGPQVTAVYLLRVFMNFDQDRTAQQSIGAVTRDLDDFSIITVNSTLLTASVLTFVNLQGISKRTPHVNFGKWVSS